MGGLQTQTDQRASFSASGQTIPRDKIKPSDDLPAVMIRSQTHHYADFASVPVPSPDSFTPTTWDPIQVNNLHTNAS